MSTICKSIRGKWLQCQSQEGFSLSALMVLQLSHNLQPASHSELHGPQAPSVMLSSICPNLVCLFHAAFQHLCNICKVLWGLTMNDCLENTESLFHCSKKKRKQFHTTPLPVFTQKSRFLFYSFPIEKLFNNPNENVLIYKRLYSLPQDDDFHF